MNEIDVVKLYYMRQTMNAAKGITEDKATVIEAIKQDIATAHRMIGAGESDVYGIEQVLAEF